MKSRLSSTIWTLVLVNGLMLIGVLWLAYSAGRQSNGASMLDFGSLPSGASGSVVFALLLVLGAIVFLAWRLNSTFISPVQELAQFSERFAAGDARSRAEVNSNDEFGFIAENLNRAVARVSKAASNQEASDHLQRSITELLTIINQVARGDLTLRGKVTNDALGNVADSINYMLDNFTKVLERVRKAAMEVTACSNNILVAADEMQAGATQQDQEITNTSSAVEELTVSMKQVSNNAEASAEAARRALDAAEQGNRAVRDTLEGMQRIRASVQATAKKIKSLGDRSLEISEIINVINDITEQRNTPAAPRRTSPRSSKRFRPKRTRPSSSWKKAPRKWKAAQRWPIRPDARWTPFPASFANPRNWCRKSRWHRNSRCAAPKASRTPCRLFPTSRARLRRARAARWPLSASL